VIDWQQLKDDAWRARTAEIVDGMNEPSPEDRGSS
jgi:hypothetical protein